GATAWAIRPVAEPAAARSECRRTDALDDEGKTVGRRGTGAELEIKTGGEPAHGQCVRGERTARLEGAAVGQLQLAAVDCSRAVECHALGTGKATGEVEAGTRQLRCGLHLAGSGALRGQWGGVAVERGDDIVIGRAVGQAGVREAGARQ